MRNDPLFKLGLYRDWLGVLGLRHDSAAGGTVACIQAALSIDFGHVGVDAGGRWLTAQNSEGVATAAAGASVAIDLEHRFGLRTGLLLVRGERP